VDASNVRQLQARWTIQLPSDDRLEATPIVVDGIMYTSALHGKCSLSMPRPVCRSGGIGVSKRL
jgi:hypothetical protein